MNTARAAAAVAACALCAVAGCSAAVPGTPASSPSAVAAVEKAKDTDRAICIDFDARGGELYTVLVVPMMAGPTARKSIDIDIAGLSSATSSVALVGAREDMTAATPALGDEAERMVAAAKSLSISDQAEATALLTAFVGLAVQCQTAGHKPSWFDAGALASN
ncbi:MAG: hypothetical protein L0H84_17220 [Pseudonocardia sp.]|nr:hypothetical protein [Pseudonocardia sp.]